MEIIERLLRLAAEAGLEGVEASTAYGTPAIRVRGKFLARVKDDDTLVMRCPLEDKAMLMAAEPAFYFETDHYRGHDAMLIRVAGIDDGRLLARLTVAWRMQAGRRAVAALDARPKPGSGLVRSGE
jgi:hypothetical protein